MDKLPQSWAKFFTTSLPMPVEWGDLEVLCEHGSNQMVSLLESAILNDVLPPSVLLAQVIQVLPRDLTVNFEIPTLVRREFVERIIFPVVFHGAFVKRSGLSVFKNAVEELKSHDRESGIVCILSKETLRKDMSASSADVLQVQINGSRSSRNYRQFRLTQLQVYVNDLMIGASQWGLLETGHLARLIDGMKNDLPSPPPVTAVFADPHNLKVVFGERPGEYFSHMAPMIDIGHVILCIPRLYAFDSSKDDLEDVGGGGCLFIVQEVPDIDLVESLYLIAHKMCSAVSGMQEVARAVSDETFAKTFRFISHSLKNNVEVAIPVVPSKKLVGRALTLERYTTKAAGVLKTKKIDPEQVIRWCDGGFGGESVGTTIKEAVSSSAYKVNIDDSSIKDCEVDPRLVAALVELCRNLSRHRLKDEEEATIRIMRDGGDVKAISILLTTRCIGDDVTNLIDKLKTKSGGANWVVLLLGRLLSPRAGGILWKFKYSGHSDEKDAENISNNDKAKWTVQAPRTLYNSKMPVNGKPLLMEFRADNIIAIK